MRPAIAWMGAWATIAVVAAAGCSDAPAPPTADTSLMEDGAASQATKSAATERPHMRPASVRHVEDDSNHPPVIRSLAVAASAEDPTLWEVQIAADDPDGDDIDLEVVWFVNGEVASRGELTFDPTRQKRGDSVYVKVTPHDGEIAGATAESGHIGIQNAAPQITSQPPSTMAGGVFRYVVEAKDPEGDVPLRYELAQKPEGMQIDPYNGELTWRPGADQIGKHTVEIVVQDPSGARSTQEFILPITAPGGTAPAAPAL